MRIVETYESYRANPWKYMDFWADTPAYVREMVEAIHRPHPAASDPRKVAYYASEEHLASGRATVTKPGRYIRKFFGDGMGDQEIERMAHMWEEQHALRELHVTQDADVIEEVYANGPRSCMSHSAHSFDSSCHPARVYAGPDLAVAYIGEPDDADGRAVVWPEKKIFARLYGDVDRIRASLVAAGYRASSNFNGARVQRIEDGGGFVMPYLDVCGNFDDDGEFLILSDNGEHNGEETNGIGGGGPRCYCERCGDRVDDDQATYVEAEYGYLCEYCLENNYFWCDASDDWVSDRYRVNTRCGTALSEHAAHESDEWEFCEGYDEWFNTYSDDVICLDDGRTVSGRWAERYAFFCQHSEEWVEETGSNKICLDDGEYVDGDSFPCGSEGTRLTRIAQWAIDEGREFDECEVELRDVKADLEAQMELDLAS